jgi:hypothetical protein
MVDERDDPILRWTTGNFYTVFKGNYSDIPLAPPAAAERKR